MGGSSSLSRTGSAASSRNHCPLQLYHWQESIPRPDNPPAASKAPSAYLALAIFTEFHSLCHAYPNSPPTLVTSPYPLRYVQSSPLYEISLPSLLASRTILIAFQDHSHRINHAPAHAQPTISPVQFPMRFCNRHSGAFGRML